MIRQLLATAVFNSTGFEMKHGDEGWNNLRADEGTSRAVYMLDPIKFNITDLTFMQETYPVIMLFMQKSQLDMTPEQLDSITSLPRQDLRAFVAYCRDCEEIQQISDVSAVEFWHVYDSDYSGWMLYFNCKPEMIEPAC